MGRLQRGILLSSLPGMGGGGGGSPKVSTSCIEPKGNTFSPEKPRKWVLTGSSFSLPMPILLKVEAKMMLAELPLSTRTRWTVLLATTARITKGSSWGC